ncbi:MAG: hypothetical protein JRC86_00390 [Deltaproteobacteria bacterium]|nr:hypothetical protein [Deltaproteobacteria bacterium]
MSLLPNTETTLLLPAGSTLAITSPSGSSGLAVRLHRSPGGGNPQSVTQVAGIDLSFGPYARTERFKVSCYTGTLTLVVAPYDPSLYATDEDLEELAPDILQLNDKTPVNAVAASGILTLSANADHLDTVTIGGNVYTFHVALGAATAADGILTWTGLPVLDEVIVIHTDTYRWRDQIAAVLASKVATYAGVGANTETVVVDTTTYTYVTALTEVKATGILTASATPADGARAEIDGVTYTFRDALGEAYDVLTEVAAADALDNLIAAITGGAGSGVKYHGDTVTHTTCTATDGALDTVDVEALAVGVAANAYVSVGYGGELSFGAGTLAGGVDAVINELKVSGTAELSIDAIVAAATGGAGEGTVYSTGTPAHTTVTLSKDSASELLATAITLGDAGNAIAIDETGGQISWAGAAVFLSGGVSVAVANDVIIGGSAELSIDNLVSAVNGTAGEGTTYGTGTVAHTTVDGTKSAADEFTATAKTAGHAGNAYASTTDVGNASWAAATLLGGETAQAANDILIGGNASDTIDNLIAAIMATAGEGTTYGTGTVVHPTVSAAVGGGDTMGATVKILGVTGNAIAKEEDNANMDWDGVTAFMTGGIDGTLGVVREFCADDSYLYYCTLANTIADANWRRVDLGAVY